ncbi:MAG: hypothetical protein QNJ42_00820 [Crocosphaera sp.]|nr:hypothetical protein [Crocosphaera sp.]
MTKLIISDLEKNNNKNQIVELVSQEQLSIAGGEGQGSTTISVTETTSNSSGGTTTTTIHYQCTPIGATGTATKGN